MVTNELAFTERIAEENGALVLKDLGKHGYSTPHGQTPGINPPGSTPLGVSAAVSNSNPPPPTGKQHSPAVTLNSKVLDPGDGQVLGARLLGCPDRATIGAKISK
jgi:hypothetical protein